MNDSKKKGNVMVGKTIKNVEYFPLDNPTKITIVFTDETSVVIQGGQTRLSIVCSSKTEIKNDPYHDAEYQWRMMVE